MQSPISEINVLQDISTLIAQSRSKVAYTVNAEITLLYWQVGKRINEEILHHQKADYGKRIILTLSQKLTQLYGKGWSKRHLLYCVKFAGIFSDEAIVHTLCAQLTWSHIKLIVGIENEVKREFFIEFTQLERWSVRMLEDKIDSMLFERTAISKKPDELIKTELAKLKNEQILNPDLIFKDPYFLDFLGLKDTYSENDLEAAILAEIQSFILELGNDFAFLSRQKRITIDNTDYYIDLLFYHRKLKCLIAIELKLGKFKHEHKSQLELYLRWLDKHERQEGENSPLGLLLCAEKSDELVELLALDKAGIHVATYFTELPPIELLKEKLLQSIQLAKNRLRTKTESSTEY